MRVARVATRLAFAVSVTYGIWFVFLPSFTSCTGGAVRPDAPTPILGCAGASFFEAQRGNLFPAIAFLAVWTMAPLLAVFGTWPPRRNVVLIALALLIELSSVISLGGGFLYALTAGPLLLVALVAAIHG
ncbi:MAG: hypothetical protein AUH85_16150 [Chloroflexi bacterium 13_1_40CM_4_68_4]|nr:MAG: hypothetical protein AUH85_16150 [Chloroflexi bacterium 13_1_40CM_4_68_4]